MATISGIIYKKLRGRNATGLVEPDTDVIQADVRLKGHELKCFGRTGGEK